MRRLTRKQYLRLFDDTARRPIESHLAEEATTGAVCFVHSPDSSTEGKRSHLPVGQMWSLRALEDTGAMQPGDTVRYLHGPTSERQYPKYYWKKPTDEEDVRWEELQDLWDVDHPIFPPLSRDDSGADRFTEIGLAEWRAKSRRG